ncbi:MAG: polyprenyl synthetase family protein [Candidatus Paracaedibacteraceae bacterium]|nr:polyprenyl synthetase family protein [Candidatus Paracaedibacteraceae bacterium]
MTISNNADFIFHMRQLPFLESLLITKKIIEPHLYDFVSQATGHHQLRDALIHSTQGSGKYIRPHLVMMFAESNSKTAIDVGCAVEIAHAYSLIHDDLPCMDNADLRRGLPSTWKAFGEATAVLAGDALIPLAYEILAALDLAAETKIGLIAPFSRVLGGHGLVGGQMMDLFPSSNINDIEQMQLLKTGELLSFCCVAGTILSRGLHSSQETVAREFGLKLGLVYQIVDDLLSLCGTSEQTGKPVHNDDDKITFVTVFGVEGSKQLVQTLGDELYQLSQKVGLEANLGQLVDFVVHRAH